MTLSLTHLSDSIWKALKAYQAHLTPLNGQTTAARRFEEISQKSFELNHTAIVTGLVVIKRDNIYVTHEGIYENSWLIKHSRKLRMFNWSFVFWHKIHDQN